jgi:hypothetical protein
MKYIISYAYDLPFYADFLVEARNKKAALKRARAAFLAGRFNEVHGRHDDTVRNNRVFVLRSADKLDDGIDPL